MENDEANGPISKQVQRVCHDTLPWLISFSLDPMMRVLDRYVGALMIFTFGFAILTICGIWLKRGNFVWTVQDHSQLVSAAQTPKGFFGYIIPSLVVAGAE